MTTLPLTPATFRQALGHFATGVTVVTVERAPGLVHGMTANSFASVSLDPYLVLVCVDHRANLLAHLKEKPRFGVNVLKRDQQAWSEYFAKAEHSPEVEERLGVRVRWTQQAVPLLENTLAQLACTVTAFHNAGDHAVVIGEVQEAHIHAGEPLLFYRGAYHSLQHGG